MKRYFYKDGYRQSIHDGLKAVRGFSGSAVRAEDDSREAVLQLKDAMQNADAVVIGAGAGLSTAAGYIYTGERFEKYFFDFIAKYHFTDMYSGGFYPYSTMEEFWGFWSRYIWINRYAPIPSGLYERLLELVKDKDYFVITTNVDHCFQRSGFDKTRLFYTQGDYGLFQSSDPDGASYGKTYDNEEIIRKMVLSQGFTIAEDSTLIVPEDRSVSMKVTSELIPYCPDDGKPMTTNLRADDNFAEDEGWQKASHAYGQFLENHTKGKVLYLELGVGSNTPVIIKYPFWQMADDNPDAVYACINYGEAFCPSELKDKAILINGDIREIIDLLHS